VERTEHEGGLSAWPFRRVGVIVAHPDDETLWAGGLMLVHPRTEWGVISLCRGSDADRRPRFFKAMEVYGALGCMGDLDDGPDQTPLSPAAVRQAVLWLVGSNRFDLVITHDLAGEYTRHRRHEETAAAVVSLYREGRLPADNLWRFAYEDDGGAHLPQAIAQADAVWRLPDALAQRKHRIITETYGFAEDSWEARATPRTEAFWYGPGIGEDVEQTSE